MLVSGCRWLAPSWRRGRGLRVRPQRPGRALFGVLLVVASVVVALTIYTRIGDRHEVLAVTRTVLAGEQLSACRSAGGVDLVG